MDKIKAKNIKTKYDVIEVVMSNKEGYRIIPIGLVKKDEFIEKFGEFDVLSTKDFEETKSTSVIIYGNFLDDNYRKSIYKSRNLI